jgi:hypothetical protein
MEDVLTETTPEPECAIHTSRMPRYRIRLVGISEANLLSIKASAALKTAETSTWLLFDTTIHRKNRDQSRHPERMSIITLLLVANWGKITFLSP